MSCLLPGTSWSSTVVISEMFVAAAVSQRTDTGLLSRHRVATALENHGPLVIRHLNGGLGILAIRESERPIRVATPNWATMLARRSVRLSGLRIGEQTS
ncbi:hypothetical protein ACFQX6_27205 [Streptosporangium lutulentum]